MNFLSGRLEDGSFVSEMGRVPLSPELLACLREPLPSEVRLGIRPEDICLYPPSSSEVNILAGRVIVREPIGSDVFLTLQTEDGPLKLRADPDCSLDRGDPVQFRFRADRLHESIEAWLRDHGVEWIDPPPWA